MQKILLIAFSLFFSILSEVKAHVLASDMIKKEVQEGRSIHEIHAKYKHADLSKEALKKAEKQIQLFNKRSHDCKHLSCHQKCYKETNLTSCCDGKQCFGICSGKTCIGSPSRERAFAALYCAFRCL